MYKTEVDLLNSYRTFENKQEHIILHNAQNI